MSKRFKIITIIIIGLLVAALSFFIFVYKSVDGLDTSVHKENKIIFPDLKDTVYIVASAWGLTGDHIEIIVSHFPVGGRSSSTDSDYIYYEPTIFYKKENDTLVIYSLSHANVPNNFNAKIKLKQIKIKNQGEMKNYDKSYSGLGLTRISVYD